MPIVDGIKMSCEVCLRGHRGAVCPHTNRPLRPVKPKGRPSNRTKAPTGGITSSSTVILQPSFPQQKSRCCVTASCRCFHLEGDLIQSKGCSCCGPGLAQQDFTPPTSLLTAVKAMSPLDSTASASSSSSATPSSSSTLSASSSPASGLRSHTVKDEIPFSPPSQLAHPTRLAPFDLDLPCTCPTPCPCPGCPSHRPGTVSGNKRKRSSNESLTAVHTATAATSPSVDFAGSEGSSSGGGCCSSAARLAVKLSNEHCQGCLPCILAPFERSDDHQPQRQPPTPALTLAPLHTVGLSRSRSVSSTSQVSGLPLDALNRTLPPLVALPSSTSRTPSCASSPGLSSLPSFEELTRKTSWFRFQQQNSGAAFTSMAMRDADSISPSATMQESACRPDLATKKKDHGKALTTFGDDLPGMCGNDQTH